MARCRFAYVFLLLMSTIAALSGDAPAAEPPGATFDAKGVKLHYVVHGKGEPVILLHGLHSSAAINWDLPGITAALAKDHQVITLDLPGHGASDKPEGDEAYGVQMVEDVVLLMDHLKIKKAHIVGYSMGGMISVKLMATHPDRVISCVVGGWGWMQAGGPQGNIWDLLAIREPINPATRQTTPPQRPKRRVPAACVRGFAQFAVTEEQLKSIKTPVTILIGDRDPVNRFYVAPVKNVRKDWPIVEIKNAGHISCVARPQFKEQIVKWIAEHGGK